MIYICNDRVAVIGLNKVLDLARGSGGDVVAADKMRRNVMLCGIATAMAIGRGAGGM